MISTQVTIVGGGIAGLACACDLADAGIEVILLEAKKHLGGRAYSFRDKDSGAMLDNCQHVLLGCCDAAAGFLEKIGSIGRVRFQDSITIIGSDERVLRVKDSPLPVPLHLVPSIVATNYLSVREKIGLARALTALSSHEPGENCSAREYLQSLSCPDSVIKRLVEPITISALNECAASASAESVRMLLLKVFMESRDGYRLGVPSAPLTEIVEAPALRYLTKRGCKTRLETKVARVNTSGKRVRSLTLNSGKTISSDAYVMAVPPWSLEQMGLEQFGGDRLHWRPIVGVHLFLDYIDPDFDCACIAGEPFGWVFNKTNDFGLEFACLHAVASAADNIVGRSKRELVELALRAAKKASPPVSKSILKRALVYRAPRATFSTTASSKSARPGNITPLSNIFLAGDWTDTPWPATIESAVRSGRAAAQAVIDS
ncbi:MAG: hydroxysqualene dehydroxylase HpnE [Armatimonadetes bacterium]|nr:hydroxysqualene dehydroxylase HpnE [Armatimonadota bacterium]